MNIVRVSGLSARHSTTQSAVAGASLSPGQKREIQGTRHSHSDRPAIQELFRKKIRQFQVPWITDVFPSSSWTTRFGVLHNIGVEPAGSTMSTWKYLWLLFWKIAIKAAIFPHLTHYYYQQSWGCYSVPACDPKHAFLKDQFFQPKNHPSEKPTTELPSSPALSPGRHGSSPKSPSSNLHLVAQLCAYDSGEERVFLGGYT